VADQITLVEGEGSTSFPITITQNYVMYCILTYGKACTVHIKAVTVTPAAKKKCFDGIDIDKITVESDDNNPSTATCGVNLKSGVTQYSLKLKATIDRKFFKTAISRQVKIIQVDTPSGDAPQEKILKTVEVSHW